jgi:uncharacterized membrane protein
MPDGGFSKGRVEAFSDGVLAVILTLMVLDLKAPRAAEPALLARLWPSFAIYLVSFFLTALHWVNHHSLLTQARRITAGVLWANSGLLLCTSLIPFATAYVAGTSLAPFPTAVYAALQCLCGLAFAVMFWTISLQRDDEAFARGARVRRRRNRIALAVYGLSIPLALVSPVAALVLLTAVSLAYVAPRFIDARDGTAQRFL